MKRSRRTLGIAAAVLVLLLIAGAGIYARINSAGGEEGDTTPAAADGITTSASGAFASGIAIPVAGAEVVRDTLVLSVTAAGQAEALNRTVVAARVEGRIARVPVRENEAVGAGETLIALDPVEYQLAVEEAEAALRQAEATYRELTLFDDRIEDPEVRAEREQVARARSGLDVAEIGLERARLDLDRTRLGAPFAGRVASIEVVPGEWVQPGDELMTVVDLNPIQVEVRVLEGEIGYLAPGRSAAVSFAAFPDTTFRGEIQTINPVVDRETRTAKVTVRVPNPEGRILPGMYARVALDARRFPDRVLVPRSAILERDRRTMLFVYEGDDRGGRAKWRYVTTGLANDSLVSVVPNTETDSVAPGEVVLVDGHYTLIHDANVRLVEDVEEAGGRPN